MSSPISIRIAQAIGLTGAAWLSGIHHPLYFQVKHTTNRTRQHRRALPNLNPRPGHTSLQGGNCYYTNNTRPTMARPLQPRKSPESTRSSSFSLSICLPSLFSPRGASDGEIVWSGCGVDGLDCALDDRYDGGYELEIDC
jgi:hypothetical protein